MEKDTKAEKRLMFALEEIVLSFIGAVVITFGILLFTGKLVDWSVVLLGVFVIWLGLLLFTVPIIRKIEQLM